MLIDTPTSNKGNTNSDEMAERFSHPDNRDAICQLIKKAEDRENYEKLLQDLNKRHLSLVWYIFNILHGT